MYSIILTVKSIKVLLFRYLFQMVSHFFTLSRIWSVWLSLKNILLEKTVAYALQLKCQNISTNKIILFSSNALTKSFNSQIKHSSFIILNQLQPSLFYPLASLKYRSLDFIFILMMWLFSNILFHILSNHLLLSLWVFNRGLFHKIEFNMF